jgi:hypothetical protein
VVCSASSSFITKCCPGQIWRIHGSCWSVTRHGCPISSQPTGDPC